MRKRALAGPWWPRLLSQDAAVSMSGLTRAEWDRMQADGSLPGPVEHEHIKRRVWDRDEIEAAIDRISRGEPGKGGTGW